VLLLARGIEDDHFLVVEEIGGLLVEAPWRIEKEDDGYRLGHADDADWSDFVFNLGGFETAVYALGALRRLLHPPG
jgi:hypothetical protein